MKQQATTLFFFASHAISLGVRAELDVTLNMASSLAVPLSANPLSIALDTLTNHTYLAGWTTLPFTAAGPTPNFSNPDAVPYFGFISKHGLDGALVWAVCTEGQATIYDVQVNQKTGDVYGVGVAESAFDAQEYSGNGDALVIAYDKNGEKLFTTVYGTQDLDGGYTSLIDYEHNRLLVGGEYANKISVVGHDLRSGNVERIEEFPSMGEVFGIVCSGVKGVFYVAGLAEGSFDGQVLQGTADVFLTLYDMATGDRTWTKFYGSSNADAAYSLQYDTASDLVFMAGRSVDDLGTGLGFLACVAGKDGSVQWTSNLDPVVIGIEATQLNPTSIALHIPSQTVFLVGYGCQSVDACDDTSFGFMTLWSYDGTLLASDQIDPYSLFNQIVMDPQFQTAYLADQGSQFVTLSIFETPTPADSSASGGVNNVLLYGITAVAFFGVGYIAMMLYNKRKEKITGDGNGGVSSLSAVRMDRVNGKKGKKERNDESFSGLISANQGDDDN